MASSKFFFFSWLTAHFLYTTVADHERFHAWTSRRSEASFVGSAGVIKVRNQGKCCWSFWVLLVTFVLFKSGLFSLIIWKNGSHMFYIKWAPSLGPAKTKFLTNVAVLLVKFQLCGRGFLPGQSEDQQQAGHVEVWQMPWVPSDFSSSKCQWCGVVILWQSISLICLAVLAALPPGKCYPQRLTHWNSGKWLWHTKNSGDTFR